MTTPSDDRVEPHAVDLYWIPLGAGHRFVRFNGTVYEAISAACHRRARAEIYHSALTIELPHGRYTVEMTPVPDAFGPERGVVASGPVGQRALGRLRLFQYEIRRWRDGVIPDLAYAVASPVRVSDDPEVTRRIFDLLAAVPTPVWGRDELGTGEMWTCNSVISWTLSAAGVDLDQVPLPAHGRAPGWDAGIAVTRDSGSPRDGAR